MSPREKFRTSEISKGWNDVVDGSQFTAASTAAMLHFTQNILSKPESTEQAAANEWRRQGAVAFLETLVNLNTENEQRTNIGSKFNPRA
jgi:hypothetical protein